MNLTSKRAEYVALGGLILSLLAFIASFVIGNICSSVAAILVSWQLLASFLMWVVLIIYFHQCSRAEQEKLDMAQLAATHKGDTIFSSDNDRQAMLNVAQNRLKGLTKWFVPIYGIVLAICQIAGGLYFLSYLGKEGTDLRDVQNMLPCSLFLVMIAFVLFLLSRFATGMSTEKRWSALRAGGSYTLVSAILLAFISLSLVFAQYNYTLLLVIMSYVTPILIIVLGAEICLNSILDIYRPRLKDQEIRFALDSRLLGIINEPGGILHTFASAMDYQFGFKVSQTWFFNLLFQAFLPLVLLFAVTLYLLSCIVVINPGQKAVIENLGRFDENSVVGTGIVFKLPFPFAKAHIYDTDKVQMLNIGFVEQDDYKASMKPLLWGEKHYKVEYNVLVSTSIHEIESGQSGAPVSLVNAAVPVKYRIKDLYQYVIAHVNPDGRLEAICNSEFAKYAASATLDAEGEQGVELSLIGAGRSTAARHLKKVIQRRADEAGLGLEIVFVGMQAVHPPPEVAEAYQGVIGAVQQRQKEILFAEADSNKLLTELCGSIEKADELYQIAVKIRDAEDAQDRPLVYKLNEDLDDAMLSAKGTVFKTLKEAESYRFEKATLAKAVGDRFAGQVKAYHANPEIYKKTQRLDMLKEALKNIRKYVVVADKEDSEVFIINLEENYASDLMNFDPESID